MLNFDAPAGSGNTFLAEVILVYVRQSGKIAVATAMSGIAATLLTLGTTCHKWFGVPVPCTANKSSKHKLNSNESRIINEAKVIMIDKRIMSAVSDTNIIKVPENMVQNTVRQLRTVFTTIFIKTTITGNSS